MIVFAAEAISDFERLHRFLEVKDPNAAAPRDAGNMDKAGASGTHARARA
jgi:hypothetical protein